ncbi:MAG: exodeoxyribonuclease VII large subunit [Deltaproteobacteria bacterium]|nr:exodeoxyribonuclease VII large subunit [Deltaproteobacteria bacterium]
MPINLKSPVQTVSEITRSIKGILEHGFPFIAVSGEVSNLRKPYSGHLYFTLKDSQAQLKAVLFKTQARYLARPVKDGDQIICRGRVSVYEARGDYQIIVDSVDFTGAGALQMAFERLKQKLSAQGIFAESHKKALPFLPAGIAVITSPQGAAVHDFLKIAAERFPAVPIEIYPAPMQGEQAAGAIISALQLIHRHKRCDIIVICRGGGSLEDLQPFNDEELARAVYDANIPVVSAIGHEIDFTILDFTADYRAPTPTAAAEAVLPDHQLLRQEISRIKRGMLQLVTHKINELRNRLTTQNRLLTAPTGALQGIRLRCRQAELNLRNNMTGQLISRRLQADTLIGELYRHSPLHLLNTQRRKISILRDRLNVHMSFAMERKAQSLQKAVALLEAVSPLAVLARGYAIARVLPDKTPLRSANQVNPGDKLDLQVRNGRLECLVTKITKEFRNAPDKSRQTRQHTGDITTE